MPATSAETMRSIVVDGQQLRVAVRRGRPGRVPMLLINGIGASLDLLQPFVDAGSAAHPCRPPRTGSPACAG
jgi:hypothetical protein